VANAADAEQVQAAGRKERFRNKQELEDVRTILELPAGRRFVWRYLEKAGIFETSFTGNNTTFFNEGRRDIGLKLLADVMQAKPEAYVQMAQEAEKREVNNA